MSKIETELSHFEYDKLPESMKTLAASFYEIASRIVETIPDSPERGASLRKLLTSRTMALELVGQVGDE